MDIWAFACLMVCGSSLTEEVRRMLFQQAKKMAREKDLFIRIRTQDLEGSITTKYDYVSFGSISGIRFKAEVDTPAGSTKIAFVIPEEELAREGDGDEYLFVPIQLNPTASAAYN